MLKLIKCASLLGFITVCFSAFADCPPAKNVKWMGNGIYTAQDTYGEIWTNPPGTTFGLYENLQFFRALALTDGKSTTTSQIHCGYVGSTDPDDIELVPVAGSYDVILSQGNWGVDKYNKNFYICLSQNPEGCPFILS